MTWFIIQSLITIIPAFLLGIAIGYLFWARRPAAAAQPAACTCDTGEEGEDTEAETEADDGDDDDDDDADDDADDEPTEPEVDEPAEPAGEVDEVDADADVAALAMAVGALNDTAAEPRDDRIEQIEGVGPKTAKALRAAGFTTYVSIADAAPDDLRAALKAGGVKSPPNNIDNWPVQARLLADESED